jgi:two-component system, OmpR family, response regulator BaeR
MVKKILIVEDEKKIAGLLEEYLENAGYETEWVANGSMAVSRFKKGNPSLVLLDLMLPGMDGIEICKELRKFSDVPIIMVTAKIEEVDRLIGLELGADDYICKPFSPREVVARVKNVLRRIHTEPRTKQLAIGDIVVDLDTQSVIIQGKQLILTPSEFSLLKAMMSQSNRVFSRNELLNKVQGYDFDGYDRTIDTHIKNLRKKIRSVIPDREIITSVYGSGYKFNTSE